MLAVMHLTPIGDFADVEPVLEQMGRTDWNVRDSAATVVFVPELKILL